MVSIFVALKLTKIFWLLPVLSWLWPLRVYKCTRFYRQICIRWEILVQFLDQLHKVVVTLLFFDCFQQISNEEQVWYEFRRRKEGHMARHIIGKRPHHLLIPSQEKRWMQIKQAACLVAPCHQTLIDTDIALIPWRLIIWLYLHQSFQKSPHFMIVDLLHLDTFRIINTCQQVPKHQMCKPEGFYRSCHQEFL